MTVRREDGGLLDEPRGWKEDRCVVCQRRAASKAEGNEGVLRFELRRGAPFMKAVARARMSVAAARGVRAGMIRRGEIASPNKGGDPNWTIGENATVAKDVERAIREDPAATAEVLAERTGASVGTVNRVRRAIGLNRDSREVRRENTRRQDLEVLEGLTSRRATASEFARAVGRSRAAARKRLNALVDAGLATMEIVREGKGKSKRYTAVRGAE